METKQAATRPSGVDRLHKPHQITARASGAARSFMEPIVTDHPFPPRRVSVVGPGRLGTALAGALAAAGLDAQGPTGRGEPIAPADAVLLCVPDAEIPAAERAAAAAAPFVGHTSGATTLGSHPGAFSLHPLQTFSGDDPPERFHGIGAAVAGATPEALATAEALVRALGAAPFAVDEDGRAAYHAAASIASNFLVTLEAAAERTAAAAGLEPGEARALLAPLVRTTVENWAANGPERALTGPIARGDEATVDAQRAAVADAAPELLDLFDAMTTATRRLAAAREVPA